MTRVGILAHSRNLETYDWEQLIFGVPEEDRLRPPEVDGPQAG
jgi:hypothetical protein